MSLLSALSRRAGGGHRRIRCPLPSSSHIIAPGWGRGDGNYDDDDDISKRRSQFHHHQHQRRSISSIRPHTAISIPSTATSTSTSTSTLSTTRQYHTTPKREILPFIAVGVLGAGVVYTYRTFNQMDKDWDDYYDAVEDYKAETGIDPEEQRAAAANFTSSNANTKNNTNTNNTNEELSNFFTGGTLAIDMGTTRLKLSHRSSLANKSQYKNGKPPSPEVSVDREGFRSTPALAWMPLGGEEDMLIGRLAQARSFDTKGGNIIHPRDALEGEASMDIEAVIQQTIRGVANNALDQALGSGKGGSSSTQKSSSTNPLFVLDASTASLGSYNVRPIFTHPPQEGGDGDESSLEKYRKAMNELTSPAGIAAFVPEPVAILAGAEYYDLLPTKNSAGGTSVLVVDVGGTSTCISMVDGDTSGKVTCSTTLPFGGDTFIDLLVSHLARDFYGEEASGTSSEANSLSSKPNVNDPAALQRLYEASTTAVHELSNKTRSEINIPYLTMDLETRQPKHLEVGMARNVVESEVESWIQNKLVPHLQKQQTEKATTLSQALPPPTNLSTLFSSMIMSSLEQTSHTPHMLRAIVLVGGGARIPLVREAMKEGVGYLAGDAYASGGGGEVGRLIMPEGAMGDELGVLGAAVWGSGGGR